MGDIPAAMNGQRATLGADHFQRLYDASPDPWRFGSSKYEQAKYRRTVASLSSRRFRSGFEAGCSVGVLTRMLATHCDTLFAVDIVEAPLQAARSACADQSWVRFAQMQIPGQWPTATFDLIVLSEVLYFLSPADVARAADRVIDTLEPGGIVLLVNWRGRSSDPCTGDEAAEVFINRSLRALSLETHYHEPAYRLDALRRIGQTKDRTRSRKRISPGPEQG
jgi:2-polyprenyl-3-methyl-5-hydroxy-6-metoxy-1,4-benzoquinol methylase